MDESRASGDEPKRDNDGWNPNLSTDLAEDQVRRNLDERITDVED